MLKYDFMSDDSIAELRNQRRLLLVDIAGTRARIEACAALLERNKPRVIHTAQQVESLKITAEIELAGHSARESALSAIINSGSERRDLAAKRSLESSRLSSSKNLIVSKLKSISDDEKMRRRYLPMSVKDNKVLIEPIKWQSTER